MASLNREEWEEMWNSIKKIEACFFHEETIMLFSIAQKGRTAIKDIKNKIQEVIGQME